MSQLLKPLQQNGLSATVPAVPELSISVRTRIREEMATQKVSQRDLAGQLKWSQGRIAHLLTGRVEMGVDDMAGFAFALGLAPSELVRDRGLEFCAEMTPTELRTLERMRQLPPDVLKAVLLLIDVKTKRHEPDRFARPLRKSVQKRTG